MNKHLSDKPKDAYTYSDDYTSVASWYYEQGSGFYIVVEIKGSDRTRYIHVEISWRSILASVGRYLKSKGKRIVLA